MGKCKKSSGKKESPEAKTRRQTQERIIATYGKDKVDEYKLRYCSNCPSKPSCLLIPLTTKGELCPYYPENLK